MSSPYFAPFERIFPDEEPLLARPSVMPNRSITRVPDEIWGHIFKYELACPLLKPDPTDFINNLKLTSDDCELAAELEFSYRFWRKARLVCRLWREVLDNLHPDVAVIHRQSTRLLNARRVHLPHSYEAINCECGRNCLMARPQLSYPPSKEPLEELINANYLSNAKETIEQNATTLRLLSLDAKSKIFNDFDISWLSITCPNLTHLRLSRLDLSLLIMDVRFVLHKLTLLALDFHVQSNNPVDGDPGSTSKTSFLGWELPSLSHLAIQGTIKAQHSAHIDALLQNVGRTIYGLLYKLEVHDALSEPSTRSLPPQIWEWCPTLSTLCVHPTPSDYGPEPPTNRLIRLIMINQEPKRAVRPQLWNAKQIKQMNRVLEWPVQRFAISTSWSMLDGNLHGLLLYDPLDNYEPTSGKYTISIAQWIGGLIQRGHSIEDRYGSVLKGSEKYKIRELLTKLGFMRKIESPSSVDEVQAVLVHHESVNWPKPDLSDHMIWESLSKLKLLEVTDTSTDWATSSSLALHHPRLTGQAENWAISDIIHEELRRAAGITKVALVPVLIVPYTLAEQIIHLARKIPIFHLPCMYIAKQAMSLVTKLNDVFARDPNDLVGLLDDRIELTEELIELEAAMRRWCIHPAEDEHKARIEEIKGHYALFCKQRSFFGGNIEGDPNYKKLHLDDSTTHVLDQKSTSLQNLGDPLRAVAHRLFSTESRGLPQSTSQAQMPHHLQGIREDPNALLDAEPEILGSINTARLAVDHSQTLAPKNVDSQIFSVFGDLLQGNNTSKADIPAEDALHEQGVAYLQKFERSGDSHDLEHAIINCQGAVNLTLDSHPKMPGYLNILGVALLARFVRFGSLMDLNNALSQSLKALDLTPNNHLNKAVYISNLGSALQMRFDRLGQFADLEDAILQKQSAVDLTPTRHFNEPVYLNNLGNSLQRRFEQHKSLQDLEDAILHKQRAVYLTPDDHPSKPMYLSNLGNALRARFGLRGLLRDLEDMVLYQRKAVNLTPDSRPGNLIYLSNLGSALLTRFGRYGDGADLEAAVSQYRKAMDLTPDDHPNKPARHNNLGNALEARFIRYGSLVDLDNAIVQMRTASALTPVGHPNAPIYLNNLGGLLQRRFERHGSCADLEDAILRKQKAIDLTPEDHPGKPMYLSNLGSALQMRFSRYGSLADLEYAICQNQMAVDLIRDDHPDTPAHLSNLGSALQMRFNRMGSSDDLESAVSLKLKAVDLTPDGHPDKPSRLNNLGNALQTRFIRYGLLADLDDSIIRKRLAVNLTPNGHPDLPSRLNSLGNALLTRFYQYSILPDLDEAILLQRKAVGFTPEDHPDKATYLSSLSAVLKIKFQRFDDPDDLKGALLAAQASAESRAASSSLRFRSATLWADCCALGSTSSLPAFDCAINLLTQMVWPGLDVDDQYWLSAGAKSTISFAVEAAIAEGEYAKAIEWAEQGRSIVWQNLLGLRLSSDELRSQYPLLAVRLEELSHRLQQPVDAWNVLDKPTLPEIASNRTALALERDVLIEEVRNKPGFEMFMKPKNLKDLAPAARDGPVVLLNLGRDRCDALILTLDDCDVAHVVSIPLERVTHRDTEHFITVLARLYRSTSPNGETFRKHEIGDQIMDENIALQRILQRLWLDYVKPVVDGLAYSVNLDSPPRLWWCATGSLAFLPFHAAGLYDTEEVGHKLSDYVISSYTPTFAALLERSLPSMHSGPKFLTVAMSSTPGLRHIPCAEAEVKVVEHLAANVTMLRNEVATKENVLNELKKSSWAHFVCHGGQIGGKPMESGFFLHDRKLMLSEIVQMRTPDAELAFLSACGTALGDGGVPDEAAHLAAGMLFVGYRGVVATMWSILDYIAPRVAEDFYRYLFRHGQPKREEAAYALHRAVRSLQESGVPFTSWVPFIYMGR